MVIFFEIGYKNTPTISNRILATDSKIEKSFIPIIFNKVNTKGEVMKETTIIHSDNSNPIAATATPENKIILKKITPNKAK